MTVSKLRFKVPPTTRSYRDGTLVLSPIAKTGEIGINLNMMKDILTETSNAK